MKTTPIRLDVPLYRIEAEDEDWRALSPATHGAMLEQLLLIRYFEQQLLELSKEGALHGPAHSSIGQEAVAVGCMSVLDSADKINGTHRMHHQFLAKALNHVAAQTYHPGRDEVSDAMREVVRRTLAEILGLSEGYTGGRGGSMHLKWNEGGIYGSNAIVGGNPPHAAGYALAEKRRQSGHIAVAFFGDGAMQIGSTYESLNLAALYDLPVVFVCENNRYAVSTEVSEQTREPRLAVRGVALGVPGLQVDGMDPVAVRAAMHWAREHIAKQAGPVLIEAETYRYYHQSGPLPGSAFGYRSKEEEAEWAERDPVRQVPQRLRALGLVNDNELGRLQERVEDVVDGAIEALTDVQGDEGERCVRDALWPDAATVEHGIRGDLAELAELRVQEQAASEAVETRSIRYIEAVSLAAREAMAADETIVILGEDVHRLRGGTAGATKGIAEAFPDRLIATPICENGFTGLAIGAALNGLRPIVEIMYPDFALVAADQLFNQAAKVRHMFGGDHPLPLVVRSRVSAGSGYGSQHSMDAVGLFALYPGWRIVAPSTPHDYIGLFNAAVRSDDPVLVVEYQNLFNQDGEIPQSGLDYIVPFGKARRVREGDDCTVLTYGGVVPLCIEAAETSGVAADIIDLRTLDTPGIDWDTIGASLEKTNRLVIAEQTTEGTSIGAQLIKAAQTRLFDWLDGEIVHVCGSRSSPVVSKVLERAALADADKIAAGLLTVME